MRVTYGITASTINLTSFNTTATSATVTGAGGLRVSYGLLSASGTFTSTVSVASDIIISSVSGGSQRFLIQVSSNSDLLIKDPDAGITTSFQRGMSIQDDTGFVMLGQGGRGLPDTPLTIYSDKVGTRPGISVVHENTGLTREAGLYLQNLDTPAEDVGTSIAFYGQTDPPEYADIQHGTLAFSQNTTTNTAKAEFFVRAGSQTASDSLPVVRIQGTATNRGYAYTMLGPSGSAYSSSYPYGAYTPAAILHVASDFEDQSDGVMVERRRTPNANRYVSRVDGNGTYLIENRDLANSGLSISSATGSVGVRDATPDATLEVISNASSNGYALQISSQNDSTILFGVQGNGSANFISSVTVSGSVGVSYGISAATGVFTSTVTGTSLFLETAMEPSGLGYSPSC